MLGGSIVALLLAAGSPELPNRAEPSPRARPAVSMSGAVQIGVKWGVVTSLHRTPERNRAVGGAPNSYHLLGRAIDIARRPGVRHAEIDAAFRRAGFNLVESLDEGDHSHFAFGLPGEMPRPVRAPIRFAVADQDAPAATTPARPSCPVDNPIARRRPDRSDGCADPAEPAPRLRPLETAP